VADANRTVRTSLVAEVSGYLNGFERAQRATRELGSEADRLGQRRELIDSVGKAAFGIGTVAAAGVALAVAAYAEFDQAMSSVQAATHASAAEMQNLRDAAIDAGATTVYTAKEAAQGIEELAKAGVSTEEILGGGLMGALDLASAGELEVADAAQIAATAMTQFNLKGSQVPHVADLLAAGAGKAQGSVEDLAGALNQGGLVASQAGFSLEETTGTLAAFASAGLLGSDAGTSLKTAIIALQSPSTTASAAMKEYGIDVYDSQGKMLSFAGIAQQLQDKLGGVSDEQRNAALATIFGTDAVRSANVLYKEGADGITEWTGKVNDQGFAAETARLKLDNLKGDVEKLGGAFDTALIKSGSAANGSLRQLVQGLTLVVDGVNALPQPVLNGALVAGTLTAAISLTGGTALLAIPKFVAFKAQLAAMNLTLGQAALRTAAAGAALGVLGLAIGAFIQRQANLRQMAAELGETLDQSTGALTKYTRAAVARKLAESDAFQAAKEAGVSQKELTSSILKGGDALDATLKKFGKTNDLSHLFDGVAFRSANAQVSIRDLSEAVGKAQGSFEDQQAANAESGVTAETAAQQYQAEASQVSDLATELAGLVDQFDKINGVNQDAITANADYQHSLDALKGEVDRQKKSVDDYTTSLDENTAVGSGNASMLVDVAAHAQEAAEKQYAVDQSTLSASDAASKYADTLSKQRQAFVDAAIAAGFNADEVKALADRIFQMPSEKQIKMLAETGEAGAKVSKLRALIDSVQGKTVYIGASVDSRQIDSFLAKVRQARSLLPDLDGKNVSGTGRPGFAVGGPVYGAGTGTSDSIPALLSNGEHVFTASDVAKAGGQAAVLGIRAAIQAGRFSRYADGGPVSTYVPTPPQIVYARAATADPAQASGGSGNRPQLVQNIYPQPMQSEAEIGRISAEEANWMWRRG
jgi:TP901 family phage tail tape measure protein